MGTMRKQIIGLAFCIAAFAVNAAAQTNTFPSSGSTGIGTTGPGSQLEVYGDAGTGAPIQGPGTLYLDEPTLWEAAELLFSAVSMELYLLESKGILQTEHPPFLLAI